MPTTTFKPSLEQVVNAKVTDIQTWTQVSQKESDSNVDCDSCRGCVSCASCKVCTYCTSCKNCFSCHDCSDCVNCTSCQNCTNCVGISASKNLKYVVYGQQLTEEEYSDFIIKLNAK